MTWRQVLIIIAAIGVVGCRDDGSANPHLQGDCEACTIETATVWESSRQNAEVMDPMRAFRLTGGDVVITDHRSMHLVRFAPDGTTRKVVGRPGNGPGEFRTIVGVAPFPDGRFAISGVDRVSMVGPDLQPLGSFRPDVSIQGRGIVALTDSTILLAERSLSRGTGIQVYDLTGRLLSSFDSITGSVGGASASLSPDGTVWVVPTPDFDSPAEFRVTQWDPNTGGMLRDVTHHPRWFAEWSPPPLAERSEEHALKHPMRPVVYDVYVDGNGLVWTLTMVQDPGFSPGSRVAPAERTDAILEALDPRTGRTLAAMRFDSVITGFSLGGELVAYSEDEVGHPRLSLVSVRLVR